MPKIFRFLLLLAVGLGLGVAVLALTGKFETAKKAVPVVAANSPVTRVSKEVAKEVEPTPARSAQIAAPPVGGRLAPPPGIGTEYLALGDSVGYGIGAPVPVEQGYAGLFFNSYLKRLQPDLLVYRNLAVPGETSASFITLPNSNDKTKSQLQRALDELDGATKAGRRVSPITLTIGGNDMLNARGKPNAERETTLTRYQENLGRILDELRAKAGSADFIVTTYYNPYAFSTGGEDIETAWVQRFNETIRKVAEARGVKVADFFAPLANRERSMTWIGVGDVHPNPAGHTTLAQALWKASNYDAQPPALAVSYSALPPDGKVTATGRLVFKVSAQDEWGATVARIAGDSDGAGAGVLLGVSASLNGGAKASLALIPARLTKLAPGSQEFSHVVDTTQLAPGRHILRFEGSDAAGNIGMVEVTFEVI